MAICHLRLDSRPHTHGQEWPPSAWDLGPSCLCPKFVDAIPDRRQDSADMLLNLQGAHSVPPNGVLDFPVIWTRLPSALRHVNLVGGHCARVATHMLGLVDLQTGFLCNLKYRPPRWILPSHHATAWQSPLILSNMLDKQHVTVLVHYDGGSSHVKSLALLRGAPAPPTRITSTHSSPPSVSRLRHRVAMCLSREYTHRPLTATCLREESRRHFVLHFSDLSIIIVDVDPLTPHRL